MAPRHACLFMGGGGRRQRAGLMVTGGMNSLEPVYFTDPRVGEAEELQVTLGQGPGTDALESGRPILVGDRAAPMSAYRWPMFTSEVCRLGVCGMSSLPLALGALQVGVLDLYSDTPGHLDQRQLMDALIHADTGLLLVLNAHSGIATPMPSTPTARVRCFGTPRFTRRPTRSRQTSVCRRWRHWFGCAPTPTPTTSRSPMSCALWWNDGCVSGQTT